jgi:hypothetical protein
MMWPPSLLGFRIGNANRGFRLWLPLCLIRPLFVLFALVMLSFVLLLALVLWRSGWGKTVLFTGPWFFRMFCALRGLLIDVRSGSSRVYIVVR